MQKIKAIIIFFVLMVFCLSLQSTGTENIKGSWFLLDNLRLFDEIKPLQDKWISIDDELADIDPTDLKFDWEKMNKKGEKLAKETMKLYAHFGEDLKKIDKKLNEKEKEKLKSFLEQSLVYADVVFRAIMKRAYIINRLYKMTNDPESWTAKEYLEEMDKYQKLLDEYEKEGKKLNEEFDKTKKITINY